MDLRLAKLLVPFALLLPLLCISVRAHAVLPSRQAKPPFEEDIEKFEAADRQAPPPKDAVVFVGSSSIRRWTTLAEDFPGVSTINRGFGGSQLSDSVRYAKRIVTPYRPRMIVFFAGTNDIESGKSAQTVYEEYREFVKVVRSELPKTPIIFISITPAPSRWKNLDKVKEANRLIRGFCSSGPNLKYLDVFDAFLTKDGGPRPELFVSDQLHLKPAGYAIWVKALGPLLPKS